MTGIDESWRDATVANRNLYLLRSGFMADCTFVVGINDSERERMQCHKFVLSQGSPVFFAMFNGELQEKGDVKVDDIEPGHFRKMLEFIYSDNTELENVQTALSVCYAANKYMINKLTLKCNEFIKGNLDIDIVCRVLEFACFIDNSDLVTQSLQYLNNNTRDVLKSASFPYAEKATLLTILSEDICDITEVEVFSACIRWAKAHKRGDADSLRDVLGPEVLSLIRFLTMTAHEFATVVIPSKLLQLQEEQDILCRIVTGAGNMPHGFNTSKEIRAILPGPRESIVIQTSPIRANNARRNFMMNKQSNGYNGQQLNNNPLRFLLNVECSLYGLQLGGLASSADLAVGDTTNTLGVFAFDSVGSQQYTHSIVPVEDKFAVNLMLESELLACAEYVGVISHGQTVEVSFKKPLLLKANTIYTLQINYSNLNTLYAGTSMYRSSYSTSAGVNMELNFDFTTITRIYIARKSQ